MKSPFLKNKAPSSCTKKTHGHQFEVEAALYLTHLGYEILAKNVNYAFGEIDLIAEVTEQQSKTLVFIEVRKRDPRGWIRPEETLTYPKQRRLLNAIQRYLVRYRGKASNVRIDLIASDGQKLHHFKDFMRI